MRVQGSGLRFKVQRLLCLRFKVQGLGLRVQGSGFIVSALKSRFRVEGSGLRVYCLGFEVQGTGFRAQGSGFTVQGLRFKAQG